MIAGIKHLYSENYSLPFSQSEKYFSKLVGVHPSYSKDFKSMVSTVKVYTK